MINWVGGLTNGWWLRICRPTCGPHGLHSPWIMQDGPKILHSQGLLKNFGS